MGFRQRLVTWSITGLVQHLVLVGLAFASALVFVTVVFIGTAWVAGQIAVPIVDRAADRHWAEAVAPLSTVPDRYPVTDTNESALRLEQAAAEVRIFLDVEGGSDPASTPQSEIDAESFEEILSLLLVAEPPAWAIDVSDCVGAPATSLRGHLQLQRLLLATGRVALAQGRASDAARMLEASWQLNSSLLRSPSAAAHLAACSIVEQEMSLLRSLPSPEDHWRVRLAALDLERHALEVYRFEAWRATCLAARFMSDIHPVIGSAGRPVASLLAHQQQEAMLFAVRELPRRDIRSFDPDAFVAEQHGRVPRANRPAHASLPTDWTSWPLSVRAALDVELGLRVLELRTAFAGKSEVEVPRPHTRQPSRVPGVDWLYDATADRVTITIDSTGWPEMAARPLQAILLLPAVSGRGSGA
jgi:hypothetical protein